MRRKKGKKGDQSPIQVQILNVSGRNSPNGQATAKIIKDHSGMRPAIIAEDYTPVLLNQDSAAIHSPNKKSSQRSSMEGKYLMPAKGMVLRRRFEPPKSSMFNPIETDKISIRQENEESTYTSGFDQTLRIGTNSQQK